MEIRPDAPRAAEMLRVPSGYYLTSEGGDLVPLEAGRAVVIGRCARTADLVLEGGQVSRAHAEVRLDDERLSLRDLGSTNGTFLGTDRIGQNPVPLAPGTRFRVGGHALCVRGGAACLRQLLQGMLTHLPVRDLVLEIERQRKSGFLDVAGAHVSGRITFLDGIPCRARCSEGDDGTRAIRRLLKLKQGRFLLDAHIAGPRPHDVLDPPRAFTRLVVEELLDPKVAPGTTKIEPQA